jgi:hypothetical protein
VTENIPAPDDCGDDTAEKTIGAHGSRVERREPTWVAVRDRLSQVMEVSPLAPYTDLKAALTAERSARIAEGWNCESLGPSVAFFFCTRAACVRGREGALPAALAPMPTAVAGSAFTCGS